ncbi:fasciclin domain-containing protein [Pontibacter anaerobius]|uniref:Fasciclin domain-containing protein n=1 Tax=Pontibacter anaerobius TaxID=2993940 RepID=A0ABT3RE72_9BACT|nr:fasciclin domain-containing protein [Pontibacter anaerobius]MCX2739708.1 fasciclin domain-containing protein [Pontibacter anaerobius]
MKKLKIVPFALMAASLFWSCAGSDTNASMNSTVSAEGDAANALEDQQAELETDASQAPMDPDTDMSEEDPARDVVSADNPLGRKPSIVALAQQTPELSTFLELIKAADMVTVLESPAPYTVFAPTNEAFAALPAGTVEALKSPDNKLELRRIIQAHVLPNRISTDEMKDGTPMLTAQGDEVIVSRQGNSIKVGDASIRVPDVQASNGVVHIIDRVLAPPSE